MTTVSHDPGFLPPLTDLQAVLLPEPDEGLPPSEDRSPTAPPTSHLGRLSRGRSEDSPWVRPTLLGLLATTGVLYLWGLGASGWANAFYSAAVQAGTQSWKALLFGSSDAASFITVDKPPASLWVMELSARVFGVSSWSILVPQALMGVASVGLLYLAVRRCSTPVAGLIAGAVLGLTPVATLMFRFNNPDAFLVLLLTASAYTTVRATGSASRRWLLATGVLVGFAFLTKSLQAFLPLPAFALVYLLAAPTTVGRRVRDLLLAGVALVVSAGWWVALVELWPASSRPYIGGSQTNSVLQLIIGYNGLGRITGNEVGSATAGAGIGGGNAWGATGWSRLFSADYGGQVAWLIPAALVAAATLLWISRRAPRTDPLRASALLWLGWLLLTGLTISLAQGIIHSYYTVALAPAIGALVGIGATVLWSGRDAAAARIALALGVSGTAVWSAALLARSAEWMPWIRYTVLVLGVGSALAILGAERLTGRVRSAVAAAALTSALLGPAAYSVQTAATAHTGSLPTAGPTVAGARGFGPGGPGGRGGSGTQGGGPGGFGGGQLRNGQAPPGFGGSTAGATGTPGTSTAGNVTGGAATNGGLGTATGGAGGLGGLLDASTPGAAITALLEKDSGSYTWTAATVGAQTAAGYQLATGLPVMSLGGFNGSDPWPTLAVFEQYVAAHQVHWFISGASFAGANGGTSATSEITSWVSSHFTARTVDGVTVYDLSAVTSSTAAASTSGS